MLTQFTSTAVTLQSPMATQEKALERKLTRDSKEAHRRALELANSGYVLNLSVFSQGLKTGSTVG